MTLRSGIWDGCRVNAGALDMHWRGRVTERSDDGLITGAHFDFPEYHGWGRVEVADAAGGRAWGGCHELTRTP